MTSPRFAFVVGVVVVGLLAAWTPPSGVAGAGPDDAAGSATTGTSTGTQAPADGTATTGSTDTDASGPTVNGAITSTVEGTATERTTMPPCPYPRGAGGTLCEATPPATETPAQHTPKRTAGSGGSSADHGAWSASPANWLAGFAPLLAWAAAVAVVAPLVLGFLLVLTDGARDD